VRSVECPYSLPVPLAPTPGPVTLTTEGSQCALLSVPSSIIHADADIFHIDLAVLPCNAGTESVPGVAAKLFQLREHEERSTAGAGPG